MTTDPAQRPIYDSLFGRPGSILGAMEVATDLSKRSDLQKVFFIADDPVALNKVASYAPTYSFIKWRCHVFYCHSENTLPPNRHDRPDWQTNVQLDQRNDSNLSELLATLIAITANNTPMNVELVFIGRNLVNTAIEEYLVYLIHRYSILPDSMSPVFGQELLNVFMRS